MNFDEKDAFVIEQTTGRNDTIHYWIKDSLLYQQDTLRMSLSYLYTDTLNQLVPRTDTLRIVSKVSWKKLQEKKQEEKEKAEKEKKKRRKRGRKERNRLLPCNGCVCAFGQWMYNGLYHIELYGTDSRL